LNEVKIILYGIGAMGKLIAKTLLTKKGVRIVGVVDVAEGVIGKDLGEVIGLEKPLGVIVQNPDLVTPKLKADLVIHATTSLLKDTYPQIKRCIEAGMDVISTCEELSYPYYKHPSLAEAIDALARSRSVTVLGTGINPGYLMDTLPITLTGPCQVVRRIEVKRVMNSAKRRIPYQHKIGTGLSPEVFKDKLKTGEISGHVGLQESVAMIASVLGWKLNCIEETTPEPVVATAEVETPLGIVKPGQVIGLRNMARGIRNGVDVIVLEFISYAGAVEEYDAVSIDGEPRIEQRITGGVHGDIGTVGMVINAIPKVLKAKPGLVTMKDLPVPSAVTEDVRGYL